MLRETSTITIPLSPMQLTSTKIQVPIIAIVIILVIVKTMALFNKVQYVVLYVIFQISYKLNQHMQYFKNISMINQIIDSIKFTNLFITIIEETTIDWIYDFKK